MICSRYTFYENYAESDSSNECELETNIIPTNSNNIHECNVLEIIIGNQVYNLTNRFISLKPKYYLALGLTSKANCKFWRKNPQRNTTVSKLKEKRLDKYSLTRILLRAGRFSHGDMRKKCDKLLKGLYLPNIVLDLQKGHILSDIHDDLVREIKKRIRSAKKGRVELVVDDDGYYDNYDDYNDYDDYYDEYNYNY